MVGKGEEKKEIICVPKGRLCVVSEFFAKACSDRWKSGRDGIVELENEHSKLFSLFLAWAFDGNIENSEDYIVVKDKDEDKESWQDSSEKRHSQLIDCYLLGQMLLAPDFQNAVIDLIIKKFNCIVGASHQQICKIYGNTTKGSPLRSSLLHTLIANGPPDDHYEDFEHPLCEPSRDFEVYLLEYAIYTRRYVVEDLGRHKAPWERDRCDYHDHPGKPSGHSSTKE